jgi:transcriptional regulator with XRE-family HTH domain
MNTKKWFGITDLENKYGPMTLGLFIRSFREADHLSQAVYAKKLKISRANLCDIEKGRKMVSPDRAAKLARQLKLPEAVLIQLSMQDQLRKYKLDYKVELKSA